MANPIRRRTCVGFTLVELLIVIMIIVMLVAILLPALGAARKKGRKVAAVAQLNSISTGCDSYMLAFHSAPGYAGFRESMVAPGTVANFRSRWTGNENLVLSLLGRVVNGTPASSFNIGGYFAAESLSGYNIDLNAVGLGPMTSAGVAYGAFYAPKPNELRIATTTYQANENTFPELVSLDTGVPLLYMRRNGHPSATITVNASIGNSNAQVNGQYLMSEIADYVMAGPLTVDDSVTQQYTNSLLSWGCAPSNWEANTAAVLLHQSLSTGWASPNAITNNVMPTNYALINAGADGIYFDKAQIFNALAITSLNQLQSFDDIVVTR